MDTEEKIKRLIETTGEGKLGSILHINVKHDDGCPALRSKRIADCNCQPDIKVVPGDHNAN